MASLDGMRSRGEDVATSGECGQDDVGRGSSDVAERGDWSWRPVPDSLNDIVTNCVSRCIPGRLPVVTVDCSHRDGSICESPCLPEMLLAADTAATTVGD